MIFIRDRKYLKALGFNLILISIVTLAISFLIDTRIKIKRMDIEKNIVKKFIAEDLKTERKYSLEDLTNDENLEDIIRNLNKDYYNKGQEAKPLREKISNFKIFILVALSVAFVFAANYFYIRIYQKRYIKTIDRYIYSIQNHKFDYILNDSDSSTVSKLNSRFNKLGASVKRNYFDVSEDNEKIKVILEDISHQIKTPLAAMSMYNEILLDDKNLNGKQKEFLKQNMIQISKLKWLIASLLKISRLDSKMITINPVEFKISRLSYNFDKIFIDKLEEKNLSIVNRGDLDKQISLDFDWTREALLNIVKNAVENAFPNSEIIIDYSLNIQRIRIDVINKGENIDDDELTKIFTRFYKSRNNKNPESVGIGLNLCSKIVKLQGGTISIENLEDGVMVSMIFLR